MRTTLVRSLAAAAILGAVIIGTPLAANADPYTPGTPGPATTVTGLGAGFDFGPGSFAPDSPVTFSVDGPGTATLALFAAASVHSSGSAGTSSSTGALSSSLSFSTAGTYSVVFADAEGNSVSSSVTVGSASPAPAAGGAGGGLADTGSNISLATVWGAGGLVLVGAGVLATRGVVRRRNASKTS